LTTHESSSSLLRGAIDLHVHAGPHLLTSPRRVDPIEAATEARDAGLRAIVLMDVFENSAGVAWLVRRHVPGIEVFGGLILNTMYGGLNLRAVRNALAYGDGAKFISFGAHSTHHVASQEGRWVDGRFVTLAELDPIFASEELARAIRIPEERPGPALDGILEEIARHPDVFLNTGHVSPEEALRLLRFARDHGVSRLLVAGDITREMTAAQRAEAVALGAYLEICFSGYTHTAYIPKTHYYVERSWMDQRRPANAAAILDVPEAIRSIGVDRAILSSDFGVHSLSTPVEGLRQFIACLLDFGFPNDDIRIMTSENPARLLGL